MSEVDHSFCAWPHPHHMCAECPPVKRSYQAAQARLPAPSTPGKEPCEPGKPSELT